MRCLLFTCLLTGCFVAPVSAESGGSGDALAYSWTGLYAGFSAGYGWGNSDWDFAGGGSTSTSDDGGTVGLQLGYDIQVADNFFAGLEASLDASNIGGKTICGVNSCETKVNGLADIAARVGVASGRNLFYLKSGLAYENSTHTIEGAGGSNDDNGVEKFGYLVGGGVEYALVYNITTKLEYDHLGFGSADSTINGTHISSSESLNLVKLAFNIKFN